jgi:hypothetical protein
VKALSPVANQKGSLEQQGAHDIVGGTNHALNLAVLWGRVGTRHPKLDTVRKKVRVEELSNSRPLSHWTLMMVQPNCVDT